MTPLRTMTVLSAMAVSATVGLSACGGNSAPASTQKHLPTGQVVLAADTGSPPSASGSSGTITTVGTGTVTGAPDTLTIGIGVSTTAPHAAPALAQNNDLATKVQQALARDGVARKDIQTTGLSLQQAYPSSDGYQVFDEVTATVSNLGNAGSIIDDALTAAGDAGRLQMVDFSMSSTDPFMSSARQSAVAAAKAAAEQLAAAAGGHLGNLVSITDEQSPVYPQPYGVASGAAAPAKLTPVPLQPGTQQVNVSVTTVWSLAP